ncbi:MAG TPA: NUDIX domain-containing protein [Anaerolineales bacterium]|nr:NUDIX domain-containing protein [Anaerolineales bacterium]
MRTRAGVILIEDNKVALIERHRAGLEYFVFPGGGVDDGESPEQGAVREAMEELGIRVNIKRKIAEIRFGQTSRHIYFLAEPVDGEFGTGTGEEFTDADPYDPQEGVYIPIWMPLKDLSQHMNIYPEELAMLVAKSVREGWPKEPVIFESNP